MDLPRTPASSDAPPPASGTGHDLRLRVLEASNEAVTAQIAELVVEMRNLRADVPLMMAEGIRTALGNPDTWAVMRKAWNAQAEQAAGSFVMGLVRTLAKQAFWFVMLLALLGHLGGLPLILAFLKLKAGE